MTKEKQLIAIAELDGLKLTYPFDNLMKGTYWSDDDRSGYIISLSYLTSRDAIIPVIEKQDDRTRTFIHTWLTNQPARFLFWPYLASATQLAEALLRATEKWEE